MKGISTRRPKTGLDTEGAAIFSGERVVGVLATLELRLELAGSFSLDTSHNPSSVAELFEKLASRLFVFPILRN